MEDTKICDLCLAAILDEDFEKLDFKKVEKLKILNVHITLNDDPLICSKCAGNLQQSFNFKSVCLSYNEYLKTLVHKGDTTWLNLQEVFVKKIKCEIENEDKKVCRFCLQSFDASLLVEPENKEQNPFLKDMLDKCLSEIDLRMTKTALMCNGCEDLLESQFKFISNCQDNEVLKNLKKENFDVDIKIKDCFTNFEHIEESKFQIKVEEYLDCKEESEEIENDKDISCNFQFPYEAYPRGNSDDQYILQNVAKTKQYKCDKCSFITKWRQSFNRHYIRHPSEINTYKCIYCPYQSKFKRDFLAHSRQHMSKEDLEKDEEERKLRKENRKGGAPTIFICEEEECSFKTNRKFFLDKHMKKHKDYDETDTYICNDCGFETKYKYHLILHFRVHKKGKKVVKRQNIRISKQHKGHEPNDIQEEPSTNNSDQICHNKMEEKNCLKNFSVIQEKDGTKYKCTECTFQTKYKKSCVLHSQKHTNVELKTVQCAICDYKTANVYNLKRHYTLKHKNYAVDEIYSCRECDYKTKCKFELKLHREIHRPIYKCEKCNYATKAKHHFRNHALTHMELSEVETFTCHLCGLVTKFRKNIVAHVKKHQAVSVAVSTNKVESAESL